MRFGRLAATAAVCVAALSAAPASADAASGDSKVKQCKKKEHPRFACAPTAGTDATAGSRCPSGYVLVDYKTAPDVDVNDNLVVCFAAGLGAVDDAR